MTTRRQTPEHAPLPSPFPEGWYFVASRAAIVQDQLIQKTWMGENIVAYCDENGRVCATAPYAPPPRFTGLRALETQ